MNLRGKQKRYLRSKAHSMRPIFQIGKEGVNDIWLKEVNEAIEKRELFKINILQNSPIEANEVISFIETNSKIKVVQKIGKVLVLYKKASNKEKRNYSLEVENI